MSKRCPDCGFVNEDSRIYCSSCGELLDANLRLLKKLNDETSSPGKPSAGEPSPAKEPDRAPRSDFDEDYVPAKLSRKKKSASALLWIILGAALVAVGVIIVQYAI